MAALEAALDDALSGQGGLVFITGEAGIGKTRLAAEFRSHVLAQGCQWLEGRYDREGSTPLNPMFRHCAPTFGRHPKGHWPR